MRLQSHLLQKEVAKFFDVSEDTITNWENNRGEPQLNLYPKVIEFLGFFPFEIDTLTLGGRIKEYRYKRGLSHKEVGKLIGVNATTIGSWEAGKGKPVKNNLENIFEKLLFKSIVE